MNIFPGVSNARYFVKLSLNDFNDTIVYKESALAVREVEQSLQTQTKESENIWYPTPVESILQL